MKDFFTLFIAVSLLCAISSCDTETRVTGIDPYDLTCEYTDNPIGIESLSPRLSWKLKSDQKGQKQTAYRILVSSTWDLLNSDSGDIWDSNKLRSDQSVNILFSGLPLESGKRYFWKVKAWDVNDVEGNYSEPAWFEMAKLSDEDWTAKWISAVPPGTKLDQVRPAPYFRKEFNVNKKIKQARLYISGLGYYKSFINGVPTGDDELKPAFTRYDRRVKYNIYDVTPLLNNDANCIGVVLGNGWYNQHTRSAWDLDKASWRNWPVLLAQLEITYDDGTTDIIVTDQSWKHSTGPITFDGIRNGEHYDARLEIPGWNNIDFNDNSWRKAYETQGPEGKLSAQIMPPIRMINEYRPEYVSQPKPGTYVLQFRWNVTGRLRITLKGEPGQEIVMKYGERLNEEGLLDQKELARFVWTGETQTDRYICKGGESETWQSSFVYHGFQFVEISGLNSKPDNFKCEVLHTDLEITGLFGCSNHLITKIHNNTIWSFLGNYHGYPTDCPHREKIGWSGDAHLVAGTGNYIFNITTSYLRWIDDFVDEQKPDGNIPAIIPTSGWGYTHGRDKTPHGYGPHWDGAYILIPWELYLFNGDVNIIKKYYSGWKSYLDYLENSAENHILNYGINDHKTIEKDPPEPAYISTAYYYGLTKIMEEAAGIVGATTDKEKFNQLGRDIYTAFNNKYFDSQSQSYEKGSQAALSGALYFNLVPEDSKTIILEKLIKRIEDDDFHIRGGVVGTKWVIGVLSSNNQNDLLYKIVDNREFPGWGYWIEQGATTLWQTWDGKMSLNHIMFGSIDEWFFSGLGGIRYDSGNPGFKHFILNPTIPDDLGMLQCNHESPYGKIVSDWEIVDNTLTWIINIPVNSESTVYIPKKFGRGIRVSGKAIKRSEYWTLIENTDKYHVYKATSGKYTLTMKRTDNY